MNTKLLIINIILVFFLSFISTLFSKNIKDISKNSKKPSYYPPNYIFGIVWPILFILYAFMLHNIYTKDKKMYYIGLLVIILTLLWTPIFTNVTRQKYKISFYYILFVLAINILFFLYSKNFYIIPQILWISFATFLSYKLYKLN